HLSLSRGQELGCRTTHCNLEVVQRSTLVFLATKPHVLPGVLEEIRPAVGTHHIVVSLVAGVTIQTLQRVRKVPAGNILASAPSDKNLEAWRGAAKMLLETGEHPAKLRADVCTPGGTTIHALHQLEKGALRATVMSAVEAATNRAWDMAKD
ncbi:PREDICTED: pyrroline-5-carboxylate reductase 3-like, partial [Lepidothrix coronata]|uniref:Pyrroline-5-carboxylate reductase 3-like n=1 Tax=Lepidothrix coronata TaxID=321398 RepID=A0A6J0JAY7_9PASS